MLNTKDTIQQPEEDDSLYILMSVSESIHVYEEKLRWAGVYADDKIWPVDALGRALFKEGMAVAAYLGASTRPPEDRMHALQDLCCCLRGGAIKIKRHRPTT